MIRLIISPPGGPNPFRFRAGVREWEKVRCKSNSPTCPTPIAAGIHRSDRTGFPSPALPRGWLELEFPEAEWSLRDYWCLGQARNSSG